MAHGHEHHDHMSHGHHFDVTRLPRMKDPGRLQDLPPEVIWGVVGGPQVQCLIDLGSGPGVFSIAFARKIPEGVVYAADLAPEALDMVREDCAEAGVPNVIPVRTSAVYVPLPDATADVVVQINLHHHLADQLGTLAECHRLLKPGGRIAIIDWAKKETPKGPPLEMRCTPEGVGEQLKQSGFADVQSHDLLPYAFFVTATRG